MNEIMRQAKKALTERREALMHVLSDKERREFEEIEAALARLADETYGLCLRCGRAIGRQRLMAVPEASFCLECSG